MTRGGCRFGAVWLTVAAALATSAPALAAKPLTVSQFGQMLIAGQGSSGTKLLRKIEKVELSERASAADLAQWESEVPAARNALIAIADASQFLPPAANEVAHDPAPDRDARSKMLARAVHYVGSAMSGLPDFFATRETVHFESQQFALGEPLRWKGRSMRVVTYRDGQEVEDQPTRVSENQPEPGLTSTGEFGPILAVVVGDAMHGQVQWGYWERSTQPVAIFRYSVPQQESHYTVTFPFGRQTVTLNPGYHGEIALRPATGEILRLTLISDLPPRFQQAQAAMMVEYAPVAIGSRTYICPVQGVALSTFKVPGISNLSLSVLPVSGPEVLLTRLNDVSFTHYHLFRAETKILP